MRRHTMLWFLILGAVVACSVFTPPPEPVAVTATMPPTLSATWVTSTEESPGLIATPTRKLTATLRPATSTVTPSPAASPATPTAVSPTASPAASSTPAPPATTPSAASPTPTAPTPTLSAASPAPSPSSTPPLVGGHAPCVYETTLTLQAYGYEAGFIETAPEDPVYPYPRLGSARVTGPAPRAYRAVLLENDYVQITVLPDLGGRLYRWIDKSTGRSLLYGNPVVKPTQWGYRGWWLSAGGIEWAFPVEEHGLNEWRPWQYWVAASADSVSITVSDIESRSGMQVGATITLDAAHSYITLQPWAKNITDASHPYQLWLNAMLALNGNAISGATHIIIPASQVIVHSTGDGALPGAGAAMAWPDYNGRDMSWYSNWSAYLGFFVPSVSDGYAAVYDQQVDLGIVRIYTPGWPAGTKFFGPSTLPSTLWTDDSSSYIELWSGATRSFADYAMLEPGQSVGWTERWYPVAGMGGLGYANLAAALQLIANTESVDIGAAVTTATRGKVTLWSAGSKVAEWEADLIPGQALRARWTRPASAAGPFGVRFETAAGVIARFGAAP